MRNTQRKKPDFSQGKFLTTQGTLWKEAEVLSFGDGVPCPKLT